MKTQQLDAAFRATRYRVDCAAESFDLRIGVVNRAFDDFLRAQGVSCWGLLTAYNPGGVRGDDDNAARQRRLLQRLQRHGWRYFSADNVADDGRWPVEPGVLIVQVGETELGALASEFSQAAIVCGEVGLPPRLVWL
ncbi:MAG: hypothetical protein H6R17_594 [Proteobacteria bacterium]|nr:hypothetical protein [Pseudomonadota bacterium]